LKPIKIPLTLERVGSEGKFFTDNMILKIMGCCGLSVVISLLIMAQASYKISNTLALILGVLAFVVQIVFYTRKIVLREKQLIGLLTKMDTFQEVNTNKFYDSYDFIDNVALHNSGNTSIFVEVIRGSTLGMSNEGAQEYYKCIQNFKNRILQMGYSYKEVNFESEDLTEEQELMLEQINGARKISTNLANNLSVKYKYNLRFMSRCVRKERWIFVIVGEDTDTRQFQARVRQTMGTLNNYHIQSVKILDKNEVHAFAREYDDTKMFDIELNTDELKEVLIFK